MLAAGLCFNIPEKETARIAAISIFFFLFIIIYSVCALALPGFAAVDISSLAWARFRLV